LKKGTFWWGFRKWLRLNRTDCNISLDKNLISTLIKTLIKDLIKNLIKTLIKLIKDAGFTSVLELPGH